jgi:hypothetical protein
MTKQNASEASLIRRQLWKGAVAQPRSLLALPRHISGYAHHPPENFCTENS